MCDELLIMCVRLCLSLSTKIEWADGEREREGDEGVFCLSKYSTILLHHVSLFSLSLRLGQTKKIVASPDF